jgi:hypothetical protein
MSYTLAHQLVGYDPETERLEVQWEIPESLMDKVRRLVVTDEDDPDIVDAYPVDPTVARDILGMLHSNERRQLDYFLEGFQR